MVSYMFVHSHTDFSMWGRSDPLFWSLSHMMNFLPCLRYILRQLGISLSDIRGFLKWGSQSHYGFQYSMVTHDLDDLGVPPWLRKPPWRSKWKFLQGIPGGVAAIQAPQDQPLNIDKNPEDPCWMDSSFLLIRSDKSWVSRRQTRVAGIYYAWISFIQLLTINPPKVSLGIGSALGPAAGQTLSEEHQGSF